MDNANPYSVEILSRELTRLERRLEDERSYLASNLDFHGRILEAIADLEIHIAELDTSIQRLSDDS